jgi:ketosteroid isomerase-like protein
MKIMKTTEELVIELADREAIRELPVRYCDCVWQNDLKTMVELFVEDGIFVIKGREREATTKGRAELRRMYERARRDVAASLHPQPCRKSAERDQGDCQMLRGTAKRGAGDGEDWNGLLRRRIYESRRSVEVRLATLHEY